MDTSVNWVQEVYAQKIWNYQQFQQKSDFTRNSLQQLSRMLKSATKGGKDTKKSRANSFSSRTKIPTLLPAGSLSEKKIRNPPKMSANPSANKLQNPKEKQFANSRSRFSVLQANLLSFTRLSKWRTSLYGFILISSQNMGFLIYILNKIALATLFISDNKYKFKEKKHKIN